MAAAVSDPAAGVSEADVASAATENPALAIDLGGTKVEAALIRTDGSIVDGTRTRAETGAAASRSVSATRQAIATVIDACAASPEWARVRAAGIGSAGPIDLASGTVSPINLPAVRGFGIVEFVRARSGVSDVTLRLDGTCIALAESWLGAARGVRNAIVMVVSTGVGAGIISDGRLVAGRSGNAGHLGQVIVDRQGDDRADATVEGLASGPRTVAWAKAAGWGGDTGEDLARDYRSGDRIARDAVIRSARAVGLGLINASTLLDLELAVIGGGFAAVADDYPALVASAVRENAMNAYAADMRVVRAELGGDAPLIGAAALVHRPDLLAL